MSHRTRHSGRLVPLTLSAILALVIVLWLSGIHASAKTLIFDHAGLLSAEEKASLSAQAAELGAKRETDFIIITLNGTSGKDIVEYVGDFYDETAPGYDKPHGNAAIIAIDLAERDVFLAGFGKAETYLNDRRLDQIRLKITPKLSAGQYGAAFGQFLELAHDYMGYKPGVNPENILFKLWFQLAVAIGVAAVTVGIMAYRSGGRVTVNANTYLDKSRSRIIRQTDHFVNKTVSRTKIERSSGGGGGGFGGGGGMTGGGRSFSGSRGKF